MADEDHVARLKKSVADWNAWRDENRDISPDLFGAGLSKANLRGAHLARVNLSEANLSKAKLSKAFFYGANLAGANFYGANLSGANFAVANLWGAHFSKANLSGASFFGADLRRADLSGRDLRDASLTMANLSEANLSKAKLSKAHLSGANLSGANLSGAFLEQAILVNTDLTGADLTGCRIYGTSAWNLKLERAKQKDLVITQMNEPAITVDKIQVAQFIYLLRHNKNIRDVIDTIGKKAVLILGSFTGKRKDVLDALREELRKHKYVPILFDFDVPRERDTTETVSLLARMARFIIADLTKASSIAKELEAIVPNLAVPVKPLLEGSRSYAMFKDYWKYDWVLKVYRYRGLKPLLAALAKDVIDPSEEKVKALQKRRRRIEAELTKPQ
jgi:uncharacterized protein YjbI with pentapeptide repeats